MNWRRHERTRVFRSPMSLSFSASSAASCSSAASSAVDSWSRC